MNLNEKLQSAEIKENKEEVKQIEIQKLDISFGYFDFLKSYEPALKNTIINCFANNFFSFKLLLVEFILPVEMLELNFKYNFNNSTTEILILSSNNIATIYVDFIFISLCVLEDIKFKNTVMSVNLNNRLTELLIYAVLNATNFYNEEEILELQKKNIIYRGYLE